MRILILIFFIFFTSANSNNLQQENKLNYLFDQLKKTNNLKVAEQLEKKIWSIWSEHPESTKLTEKLEFGIELMEYGNYDYALKVFDNIIKTDSRWAEVWNKRATVFFLMSKYKKSLNDIDKVLSIESRHFGALSGQARIFIKLHEYEKAIVSLERALMVYPLFRNSELIPQIKKIIKEESI